MGTLKGYVRNKAQPEGSIAEAYIYNECLTFCSMYLKNVETRFNRVERNYDGNDQQGELSIFSSNGRTFGGAKYDELNNTDWEKARLYVLNNCDEVNDYIM